MEKTTENAPRPPGDKKVSRKRQVLSVLLWVLGWPLIIGLMSIPVFGLLAVVFGTWMENGWADAPGALVRGYAALVTALMVLICLVCIWLKKRKKTVLGRVSANVLKMYMWMGIVLGTLLVVATPDPQSSSANAGINVEHTNAIIAPSLLSDPVIIEALQRVGATDIGGIETKYVDSFEDMSLDGQAGRYQAYVDATGKWSYGVLSIKRGLMGGELDSVVAHEYLHHIWFKTLDEKTKLRLTSDLITIYGNDPDMHARVATYSDNQSLQPTELFSYYCTESSDGYLTSDVLSECAKYINRSALSFAR